MQNQARISHPLDLSPYSRRVVAICKLPLGGGRLVAIQSATVVVRSSSEPEAAVNGSQNRSFLEQLLGWYQ